MQILNIYRKIIYTYDSIVQIIFLYQDMRVSSYTFSMDLWNDPAFLNDGGGGRVGNRVGTDPFFTEEMQTTSKKNWQFPSIHYFTHFKTLSGFLDDKCISNFQL